jgi:peptide/nickel transport system substrate-binding protein
MVQQTRKIFVLMVLLAGFLLGSCSVSPETNSVKKNTVEPRGNGMRGGSLTYRLTTPPKSFNYVMAADEATIAATFVPLTSGLIDFDHSTQQYVAALAESWSTSADGKTVTIKLREGLKFSDGDDLTTEDVIFTLAAIYDEKTNSPAYRDAMLVGGKQIETRRINDREMELILPEPVASPENYIGNLGVLPSHVLDGELKAGKFAEAWKINAPAASVVSSGPFIVESSTPGERIDYTRNPHYWKKDQAGTQLPYLDQLRFEVLPDANNTFVRLSQGSLDLADRVRPTDHIELSKNSESVKAVDAGPGLSIDHMWFNLNVTADGRPVAGDIKHSWFSDRRFRRAISMAVDRQSITSITLQGLASPLYGFVSPANRVWIAPELPKIEFSVEKASQLLQDAGFQKGGTAESPVLTDPKGNPVEFSLIVPAESEPRKLMAAVIQEDLAKLGVKVQVVPIENAALTEKWSKTFDYDAVLFGLSQTDIEPSSFQNFLRSSAGTHQWRPKQASPASDWEARIDQLFAQQSEELDPKKRHAIFAEIQMIMSEEMPVIPIAARHVLAAVNTRVGNHSPSSIFPYSLWNLEELFIKQ